VSRRRITDSGQLGAEMHRVYYEDGELVSSPYLYIQLMEGAKDFSEDLFVQLSKLAGKIFRVMEAAPARGLLQSQPRLSPPTKFVQASCYPLATRFNRALNDLSNRVGTARALPTAAKKPSSAVLDGRVRRVGQNSWGS